MRLNESTGTAPNGVFVVDDQGHYLEVNRAACQITGYSEAQLLDMTIADLSAPEWLEQSRAAFSVLTSTGKMVAEVLCRKPDGTRFWLEIHANRAQEGRFVGFATDITERKQAQEALRKAHELLRFHLDRTPLAHVGIDMQARINEWNPAAESIFGYTRPEAHGRPVLDLVPADVRSAVQEVLDTLYGGNNASYSQRGNNLTKDGRIISCEWLNTPLLDEQGQVIGIACMAQDVTERERAQQALARSEERYRSLAENAQDFIFLLNRSLELEYVNAAGAGRFNQPASELVGKSISELFPPEQADFQRENIEAVLRSGEPKLSERSFSFPNGKRWINTRLVPVRGANGEVEAVMGIARDVSDSRFAEEEKRSLEARVQHAQKLESLGVLAGGIAHDFNNLLIGVLASADLVLQKLPADSTLQPDIEEIALAARRCAELTKQMLAYSGQGEFVLEEVDLRTLLSKNIVLLRRSISKTASLEIDLPEQLPGVMADASQIQQIVMNLVVNASDAIGEHNGRIVLSARRDHCSLDCPCRRGLPGAEDWPEQATLVLEVTDTGCGMDEETQARIFDPFFTTKFTGRGLGLAAVHGILRGHKAGIEVESELDKGTTIRVHLPALDRPATPTDRAAPSGRSWRGSGTILLVDDEPIVRRVARRALMQLGFAVLTAVDGLDAVEVFEKHVSEVVCILLDLTMPNMSGEQAFVELRKINADVPIVLSSGFSEEAVSARFADDEGPSDFIRKPYELYQLRAKMRSILDEL